MKKNIIILSAIVLIAIAFRFIFSAYGQFMQGKMMAKGRTPIVSLDEIKEAKVIKKYEAPGRIVSKYRVDVMARIDGYLVKSYFKEGDYVKKGQVLFQIEPQEWSYDVQKARATAANTKAQLVYAEKQTRRSEELVKKDYISKASYDSVVSQRDALKAQLAMNQADIRNAQRNLNYTRVSAPVDGQVGIISVTVGNFVNQTAGPLTTVFSTTPIFVTFPMDSKDYLELTRFDGQDSKRKVEIVFPNGEKYDLSGLQDFHDNKIDETTGTITLRATFPNPNGKLINGEFVKVTMYSNSPVNVPVVPQVAVMENPQGKYVYTLDEKNIPQIMMIKVNGQYKDNWIVQSGLKKGDKIIVNGIQKVIPDQPVKIVSSAKEVENQTQKKKRLNIKGKIRKWLHISL